MTGNDAEFVHVYGAAGPLLNEVPKASTNTYAPMGHGSLRETNDLADELFDMPLSMHLGNGKTLTRIGFVLLMLCWFGLGVGLGIYLGKHFVAP